MKGQPNYEDIYEKLGKTLEIADEISKNVHGKYIQFICKNSGSTYKLELKTTKTDKFGSKGNDYSNENFNFKENEKSEEFEELEEFEECEDELDSIRANSCSYYENSSCDKI